jgi:hypothetical protein
MFFHNHPMDARLLKCWRRNVKAAAPDLNLLCEDAVFLFKNNFTALKKDSK